MDDYYNIEQQIKEIRIKHDLLKESIGEFLKYPKKRNSASNSRQISFKIGRYVNKIRKSAIKITQDIDSNYD